MGSDVPDELEGGVLRGYAGRPSTGPPSPPTSTATSSSDVNAASPTTRPATPCTSTGTGSPSLASLSSAMSIRTPSGPPSCAKESRCETSTAVTADDAGQHGARDAVSAPSAVTSRVPIVRPLDPRCAAARLRPSTGRRTWPPRRGPRRSPRAGTRPVTAVAATPPPSDSGQCRVPGQGGGQRAEHDLAVPGHPPDRVDEFSAGLGMPAGQQVDVREVPPARVGHTSLDRGDDLLGVHHRQRVPHDPQCPAQQPRQIHRHRGCDRRPARPPPRPQRSAAPASGHRPRHPTDPLPPGRCPGWGDCVRRARFCTSR